MDRLMTQIVCMALAHIEQPGVAQGLAAAVISRINIHDDLVPHSENDKLSRFLSDDERRRKLLEELLPQLALIDPLWGLYGGAKLFAGSDFDWLLQRILAGRSRLSAHFEAKLCLRLIDSSDADQMCSLWHACQSNSIVNTECKGLFAAIDLNSDIARFLRSQLAEVQVRSKPKLLDPSPSDRVERDLENVSQNQLEWWAQLVVDLTLEPASTNFKDDLGLDLRETHGWKEADANTKNRIVNAAGKYVQDYCPHTNEWFGRQERQCQSLPAFVPWHCYVMQHLSS